MDVGKKGLSHHCNWSTGKSGVSNGTLVPQNEHVSSQKSSTRVQLWSASCAGQTKVSQLASLHLTPQIGKNVSLIYLIWEVRENCATWKFRSRVELQRDRHDSEVKSPGLVESKLATTRADVTSSRIQGRTWYVAWANVGETAKKLHWRNVQDTFYLQSTLPRWSCI